ncbi:MAG TPA: Rrf2 family transcriptional regulator [Chitinophagaceae bacterium]|nr:Rrf2 family transcriptional regulator [Chitinophagaceae bacterium]
MLSYTCKAAIKAVLYLASRETHARSSIREIAEAIGASEHTTAKMLQQLARQRLIGSSKGPSGGFFITRDQLNQPLITIVSAIDGKDLFTECGLGLSRCSASHPCPLHDQYKAARDQIRLLFETTAIHELALKVKTGLSFLADEAG